MKGGRAVVTLFALAASSAAATQEAAVSQPAVAETTHFAFDLPLGRTPADAAAFGTLLDEVFDVVVARLGVSFDERVRLIFSPPDPRPCGSRGLTPYVRGAPTIILFADEDTGVDQILAGLAHELGHVLQERAIEGGRSLYSMFNEGFVTWAAGPYWLDWQGEASFQSAVSSYVAAGTYLALHENDGFLDTLGEDAAVRFGDGCLKRRDVIYSEWAAFVDYLVEEYGREKLYLLFQTPRLVSGGAEAPFRRPNFAAVYGSPLERLEAAWLERVTAND